MTLDHNHFEAPNESAYVFPDKGYHFNSDWMSPLTENLGFFELFRDQPTSLLEIGVMEGRSACWFFEEVLTHPDSRYTGIDNWEECGADWMADAQEQAVANITLAADPDRWELIHDDSIMALSKLHEEGSKFDVIYIDGNHSFSGCLGDTYMSWSMSKRIIVWDDYRRKFDKDYGVWKAVQWFLRFIPDDQYKIVLDNYQFAIEKHQSS